MDYRLPPEDVWRLGADIEALIRVMVMCSLEMYKCQHALAVGI